VSARPQLKPASAEEQWFRRMENVLAEEIATREGDRLLKLGDEDGANVAYKIAGALRIRRDQLLEPF
jgi:hypothetical protein